VKVVITGGHHTSALPVIEKLKKEHPKIDICFVGHKHTLKNDTAVSLEYQEINSLGIPFYELKAGKIYGIYNPFQIIKIISGFIKAFGLLLKIRPDAILSFGGYLAAPVVVSGWFLRIPSITHEQTVVAGYANRLISKFARKILISWESSRKYFPAEKIVYSGLPLRSEIFAAKSNKFIFDNDLPVVYITGGKTGAHNINLVIKEALPNLLSVCNVIHQCGDFQKLNDFEKLQTLYKTLENVSGKYYVTKFVMDTNIGEAFTKADIVVARSGAHTTMELLALEKPSILIPIPWVSHNEQFENAKVLEDAGLAKILPEDDLTPQSLVSTVSEMVSNIKDYKLNDVGAKKAIKQDATEIIVNELLKLI
jgi:UDP-N-acetylglucosamine--N-acetylmuramyl-(pentapeptide) pyrophosphoryl-undecaprenol N-acetylglucosamine transferase